MARVAVPGESPEEDKAGQTCRGQPGGERTALSYFKMLRTAGQGVQGFFCINDKESEKSSELRKDMIFLRC